MAAGIDKGQISSYLSGKYKPKQENLSLVAAALDVSEYWLMGLDVSMDREGSEEAVRGESSEGEVVYGEAAGGAEDGGRNILNHQFIVFKSCL